MKFKYKLKSRKRLKPIKGDLIKRTKKAFTLTPSEKKALSKGKKLVKIKFKKKLVKTKKKYSGKNIDFHRFFN